MAKFLLVTIMAGNGPQPQAVNIDAITRFIPVKEESGHPERTRIFLMGPVASEDRFECVHTFQELHAMINEALASPRGRFPVSATHDTLRRTAQQLIATSIALLHTLEALRREMEKRLDDSEARMVRTRQLLADSTALLQQSKSSGYHRLPAKPMLRNRDSNQPTTQTSTPLHFSHA